MFRDNHIDEYFASDRLVGQTQSTVDKKQFAISKVKEFAQLRNKDFCEFTADDINDMYRMSDQDSRTLMKVNGILKDYTDWCIENGYTKQNNLYAQVKITTFTSNLNRTYYSEQALLSASTKLDNPMDVFLLLAPFYGLRNNDGFADIAVLTSESFDEKNNTVTTNGRTFKAHPRLIRSGIDSANTYKYYWQNGRSNDMVGDGVIKFREGTLLTNMALDNLIRQKYSRLIRKRINDPDCTYKKIFESGIVTKTIDLMFKYNVSDILDIWDVTEFQKEVIDRFQIPNKRSFLYVYGYKITDVYKDL